MNTYENLAYDKSSWTWQFILVYRWLGIRHLKMEDVKYVQI